MNEGLLNRGMAQAIARQGHMDEMIISDAGIPLPDCVEVIDVSIKQNVPTIETVLEEILRYHSVEKLVVADVMAKHSPSKLESVKKLLPGVPVELIPHDELKKRAHTVKTIVRTGDFTDFSSILLVSGAGDRWYTEKE